MSIERAFQKRDSCPVLEGREGEIPPCGSIAEAGSLRLSDTTTRLRPRGLGLVDGGTRSSEQGFHDAATELRGRPRPWQIPGAPSARRSC